MMKTKLKFFLVLLAVMVGGVNGAWADTETYDFEGYADYGDAQTNAVTNYGGTTSISYNGHTLTYLSSFYWNGKEVAVFDMNGRFAAFGVWNIRKPGSTTKGLYSPDSGDRELSILNLCNGDKVTIYTSGTIAFSSTNAKTSGGATVSGNVVSGDEYTMTEDGHLDLTVNRNDYIQKIVITHPTDEVSVSFTSIPTNNKLTVDDTFNATVSYSPSTATVVFSSSNTSAATISSIGTINAVGVGVTTISATLTVGGVTRSASFSIEVESPGVKTYSEDFTGCGTNSTLVTNEVSGKPYRKIDFHTTYGNKTFNLLDFFALDNNFAQPDANYTTGIFLADGGIDFKVATDFYVLSLHNGDRVTIEYYATTSGNISVSSSNYRAGTPTGAYNDFTLTGLVTEDGEIKLSVSGLTRIKSIEIVHDWDGPSFIWSDANLTNKFDTSTGGKLLRYKITDMNFTEPTAVKVPADATHTVRSLNQNVAIMDEHNFGDVLFVNTGTVNIQGTLKTNGTDYRDTYTVDVWADVAEFTDVNNRYEVTGIGKLQEREVTAVRGLKMNFGSDDDATLVLYDATYSAYVAYTINKLNGWRHRDGGAQSTIPTHGSFYKFEALTNGKLKFSGVKNGDDNTVVLMDASNMSGSALFTIGSTEKGIKGTTGDGIQLTAGHTYYLFGNVPADGNYYTSTWSAYMLTWFSFDSEFKLVNTINNVETEVNYGAAPRTDNNNITSVSNFVTVKGDTNPTVTIVGSSGDISTTGATVGKTVSGSNTILSVSGLSGTGGSIRFRVTSSGGGNAYFNLTIPFATHSWDFRTGTESGENGQSRSALATEIKTNGTSTTLGLSGITRVYRSSNKNASGVWEHIGDPLLAANGNVEGDNGFFIGKTSGLIFVTGAKSFGALETECTWQKPIYTTNAETGEVTITGYTPTTEDSYTIERGLTEVDDETEYYFGPEVTNKAEYVYMKTGSKIIFPGVRPGQYIKLYTRRLSALGDHWKAENLVDLQDKAYTSSDEFTYMGINEDRNSVNNTPHAWAGDNLKGSAIFKVPTDYNASNTDVSKMPSLTVTNGWVRIVKIELLDEYKTDLYLSVNNQNTEINEFYKVEPNSEFASIVVYKKNGTVTPNAATYTYTYEGTVGKIGATHSHTCDYEVVPDASVNVTVTPGITDTGVKYNKITLQYNGGNGLVKIIQREYGDDTGKENRADQHVISKKETYIAVSEVNVQTYPYTWDFTTHNMYQGSSTTATNLGNATGTNYGTWTRPTEGVNTFQVNNLATINTSMQQKNISNYSYEQVTKPLFAQGGQLSAGSVAIAETEGLGVSRPNGTDGTMYTWKTGDNGFGRYGYTYKTYDLTSSVTINGSTISGMGTITIPQVDNNMYVFVKANAAPSDVKAVDPTGAVSDVSMSVLETNNDNFKVKSGVYLYKNTTGSTKNILVSFSSGTTVELVAVTNIVKRIGETGYATESRNCAIDHSYEDLLTQHPVKAYAIETYEGGTYNYRGYPEVKKWGPLHVVPSSTGVVLCEDGTSHDQDGFNSPFFVPAVNVTLTTDEINILNNVNWMEPQVSGSTHEYEIFNGHHGGWYQKFILTKTYYVYSTDATQNPSDQKTADIVGFYRMRKSSNPADNYMPDNTAFLVIKDIPTALWNGGSGARQGMIYLDLDEIEGSDATQIDNEVIIDHSRDNDVYYSISGARISGKPTTKGIYIHNGKKVSVK